MLKDRTPEWYLLAGSAIIFSTSFSFGIAVNSIAFTLFIIVGLAITARDLIRKRSGFNQRGANYFLVALFSVICLREFIAEDTAAFGVVVYYLAFLCLPIVIAFQSQRLLSAIPMVLKWFLYGCLFNVIVNLGYAIYRGLLLPAQGINFWYFTYDLFTEPFGIQPIYLGLFYVFAVLILLHYQSSFKNKILFYSALLLLTLGVFLSSARIAMVCLVLLAPIQLFLSRRISIKSIVIMGSIFSVCFLFAIQNPVIKNRIFKVSSKGNVYSGTSLRQNIWESAFEVSKENFFWGTGEKTADSLLVAEYQSRGLDVPVKFRYHSHNQYLQTLIQYGLVGLLILLAAIFGPMIRAINNRNFIGLMWLLLFAISASTESLLTRQWGIFSFAFFSSLLMLYEKRDTLG